MAPSEEAKAHQPSNAMKARTLDARSLRKSREASGLRIRVCRHRSRTVVHSRERLTESSVAQEQREMARGSVHGARRQVADESSLRVGGGGGICATTAIKRSWHASGLNTSRLSLMKPNLAFKRTPNGRPRNGIMLIFTIARPAVWRRLTLR
jgi:CRISPR/Cas system CSM-associated protein Csm5 (group 7 of RAMP superfamily)